jgi:8-amino-7-oxononanoate synthase
MLLNAMNNERIKLKEFFQAHGTFVCGQHGGGVAEEFNCDRQVDICIGTLSKAAGCHGGFIACRY